MTFCANDEQQIMLLVLMLDLQANPILSTSDQSAFCLHSCQQLSLAAQCYSLQQRSFSLQPSYFVRFDTYCALYCIAPCIAHTPSTLLVHATCNMHVQQCKGENSD